MNPFFLANPIRDDSRQNSHGRGHGHVFGHGHGRGHGQGFRGFGILNASPIGDDFDARGRPRCRSYRGRLSIDFWILLISVLIL